MISDPYGLSEIETLLHLYLSAGEGASLSKSGKKEQDGKPEGRELRPRGKTPPKGKKRALSPKKEMMASESHAFYVNPNIRKNYDERTGFGIGELAEKSLHATLKHRLAKPGDRLECKLEGKIVDLLRANGEIVEVQTGNFGKLRDKIERFIPLYKVRVIYPIPERKTIVQIDKGSGEEISRRKSPKRGSLYSVFEELIHYPGLLSHPGVSLEILLVEVEELRVKDGQGSWRRKFQSILDKRLSGKEISHVFSKNADLLELLPRELRQQFTTSDLAAKVGISSDLARKMAYVLKKNGLVVSEGKRGREILYSATIIKRTGTRKKKEGSAGD